MNASITPTTTARAFYRSDYGRVATMISRMRTDRHGNVKSDDVQTALDGMVAQWSALFAADADASPEFGPFGAEFFALGAALKVTPNVLLDSPDAGESEESGDAEDDDVASLLS